MSAPILRRIVVPIKNEMEAQALRESLPDHLDDTSDTIELLYVIEQTERFMDPASPEALIEDAHRLFDHIEAALDDTIEVQTEIRAGPDAVKEIVARADAIDATAIVFSPWSEGRLSKLLTGDDEHRLLTESHCPVLAIKGEDQGNIEEVTK